MGQKLKRYLINYFGHLMTPEERAARYSFILEEMALNGSEGLRARLLPILSTNPAVLALMENGYDSFATRVAGRVLRDHPPEELLNLCPKCSALTNTPTAKQCPTCFHSWHDVE